jgi:hypothetical protein
MGFTLVRTFIHYTPASSGGLAAYVKSDIDQRSINIPESSGNPAAYIKPDIGA